MALIDDQLAELRAIPAADVAPRSITDRWADSEQDLANATLADGANRTSPEQTAAEPDVLESPDSQQVPYGTTF